MIHPTAVLLALLPLVSPVLAAKEYADHVFKAGDASLQHWLMPAAPPAPQDNPTTLARVELGKMLFFDTRLSGDGNMSCATCHNPMYGWSDGLKTAKGFQSQVLGRASPTIINTGYNTLQMWDGRKTSLEDQALGPMLASVEMNKDIPQLKAFLASEPVYSQRFAEAFPSSEIDEVTIAQAIAAFERTIVSTNSPFDQWVKGDAAALTKRQVEGFELFANPEKGNCVACHAAPNFTDDGFHNVGLASWGIENPDMGRYAEKPLGLMKGAFKTPTLRDITLTAPYFHDGSAATLDAVVSHYRQGGVAKTNLSPSMKSLTLTAKEEHAIVDFLTTLTSDHSNFQLPQLPPRKFVAGASE